MNKLLIITDITVLESAVNDPGCAVILPDLIQTRNFYNYLINRGIKSIDLSKIYTVQSFTAMVLNISNLPILPRFLERVITKDLLLQLQNENPDYAELANYPEFVSLFLEEFDTLQSNIDLETVNDPRLSYFKKFSMLFNQSLQRLNYLTIKAVEERAAEKINKEGCRYRKLYFANFFMIDNMLLKLIESLLSSSEVIMFYYDSDSLQVVKERLGSFDAELYRKDTDRSQSLQFLAVPDQRSEIITIARKIAEYVHSKNARFEEFMVAFRDAKLYEPLIKEIFSRYNIPYFIEVRQRFQDLEIYTYYRNIVKNLVYTGATQFLETLVERLELQRIDKEEYRDSVKFINYLRQFNDHIASLQTLYGSLKPQQFVNLLNIYIDTYTYGNLQSDRNVVKIIDIGNIFFNFPKYLFVGNMKEGVFPRIMETKDLIDPMLKSQYRFYYRTGSLDMKNEDYYFDTLLQSSENIIFTYSYRDQKAKREYQSRYLRKLEADKIIKKQEYDPLKFHDSTVFYSKRELLQALIFNRHYQCRDKSIEQEVKKIIKVPGAHEIEDKNEIIDMLKTRVFTPTELTQYKKCGLSYFYRYILQITKPEELLGVTGTGTLYHNILRDYYSDHKTFKEQIDKIEIKRYVSRHLSKFKGTIDDQLLDIVELSVIKRLYNFLTFDQQISRNRVVKDVEYPFTWNIDEYRTIKGRIDRIDNSGSSFVVIDYKYTSSDTLKKQYREDLAMPIYLTYMRDNNMHAIGKYYSIKLNRSRYTPDLEKNYTKTVTLGKGEEQLDPEHLKEELREYINNIRTAKFKAEPGEDCRYCDYYDICTYYMEGEDHGSE